MGKPITRSSSNLLPPTASKMTIPPCKTTTTTIPAPAIPTLTLKPQLDQALTHLRAIDSLLDPLISTHPPPAFFPPPDNPPSPFLSLTKSILYQQLAPSAAGSIYARFLTLCGGESNILPSTVLSLSPSQLRDIGVSGRKSLYLKDLSEKFQTGTLSDESILEMEDEEDIIRRLTAVKGIGVWTVHMFMMFNLGRGDVLPVGDLGVRKGVMCLYGLKGLPKEEEMERVCEKWRPYRSVGSWYMWKLMEANNKALKEKKERAGSSKNKAKKLKLIT